MYYCFLQKRIQLRVVLLATLNEDESLFFVETGSGSGTAPRIGNWIGATRLWSLSSLGPFLFFGGGLKWLQRELRRITQLLRCPRALLNCTPCELHTLSPNVNFQTTRQIVQRRGRSLQPLLGSQTRNYCYNICSFW